MKKLYNKKGKVHPSPSPPPPSIADPLALLPATILTLTFALSAEDQEVLAYLISYTHKAATQKYNSGGGATESGDGGSHPPMFQCDCFRCYTSFWARWDASPNRQVIHEIIEAYEEKLVEKKRRNSKVKKERRKNKVGHLGSEELVGEVVKEVEVEVEVEVMGPQMVDGDGGGGGGAPTSGGEGGCEVENFGLEKGGTMRRLVGFIGDRIWGVWNRV